MGCTQFTFMQNQHDLLLMNNTYQIEVIIFLNMRCVKDVMNKHHGKVSVLSLLRFVMIYMESVIGPVIKVKDFRTFGPTGSICSSVSYGKEGLTCLLQT